jgi:hypothetical protein
MHTEELMVTTKAVGIPLNVTTRIDGRAGVVVDESGDGVATGAWDECRARWIHDDDGLPVMAALRVRDDATISDVTSRKLATLSGGISAGQIKRAKKTFNTQIQAPVADGGFGIPITSSDPHSHNRKARATVRVSLLAYVTALFDKKKVDMGPSQAPFVSEEEEKRDDAEVKYLDILIQGDGRNFGAHCSNVQSFLSSLFL